MKMVMVFLNRGRKLLSGIVFLQIRETPMLNIV